MAEEPEQAELKFLRNPSEAAARSGLGVAATNEAVSREMTMASMFKTKDRNGKPHKIGVSSTRIRTNGGCMGQGDQTSKRPSTMRNQLKRNIVL
jgi:hypothetical protein